jgi:antitoxin ParD1/3/4
MNISLPDTLRSFVEEQVSSGGYSTVSEYIRELVRSDQKRKEEHLASLLLAGLNSGEPIKVTPEYVQRKWERLLAEGKTPKPKRSKR